MSAAPTKTRPSTRSFLSHTASKAASAVGAVGATADPVDKGDVAYLHGNLLVNPEGTWALYALGGVDVENRPVAEVEGHADAAAHRWADLTGRVVRMWGVPMQFPTGAYLDAMRAEYPNGLADVPAGASHFEDQLERKAAWLHALDARRIVTVMGVRVTTVRVKREHLPLVLSDVPCAAPLGDVEKVRADMRRTTRAVARGGFAAEPLTESEALWAIRATRAPGLEAPHVRFGRWGGVEHMGGFGDAVHATTSPFSTHTTIRGMRGGRAVTSHVTVLRATIPETFNLAERTPWLAWFDSLGPEDIDREGLWRVQWALTMRVQSGLDAASKIGWHKRLVGAVAKHYAEHDAESDEGAHMARLREAASDSWDEAMHGRPEHSARPQGQLLVTVSADTVEHLQAAVETVQAAAASEQDMTLVQELGQWVDYRATVVGNVWNPQGHTIHPRVSYLAAGLPNASPAAGDPTGTVLANIAGSNDAYVFNGLHGRENGRAGVGVIAGAQGSGKTATAVMIADDMCQSGVRGTAFTPDGQMAQILAARHYQGGKGRVIPLTQVTTPGIAMPSLMVPEPVREPGESVEKFEGRVDEARATRIRYERDWLTSVLPGDMQRGGLGVSTVIENAVAKGEGVYGLSPWEHVARLYEDGSPVAKQVADVLTTRSMLPTGRLGFPRKGEEGDDVAARQRALLDSDALFTCITIPGVQLAQSPDKSMWRDEHFDAEPVLMAGLRLSALSLFSDREPGWFIADEVDIATGGATAFTPFLLNLIYDIRKYGKWCALLVKSMSTLHELDEHVTSLLGFAGVGRMGVEGARACLPLLGGEVDPSIASLVPSLDDGEFFWRGWDDRVRRLPIDQSWWHQDVIDGTQTKRGGRPERLAAPIRSW